MATHIVPSLMTAQKLDRKFRIHKDLAVSTLVHHKFLDTNELEVARCYERLECCCRSVSDNSLRSFDRLVEKLSIQCHPHAERMRTTLEKLQCHGGANVRVFDFVRVRS